MTRDQWTSLLHGVPFRVACVIIVAIAAHLIVRRVIHRFVDAMSRVPNLARRPESAQEGTRRHQRATSVGQLMRSAASVGVWSTAVLICLQMLGVDIAPLLASAGIVGVAIGFGAQSLVKDYFAGIVIVIEDQFGVGDEVDIDGVAGAVVEVGLRTTRLRSVDGSIVWVRNGDISRVRNRSQGESL